MKNNLFYGTITTNFKNMDTNPKTGNPFFNNEGSGTKNGYQLNANSNAINMGVAKQGPPIQGAGTGVFENISAYPTVDFYGNAIDMDSGTPNIGACNAKNGEITLSASEEILNKNNIHVYPNPAKDTLYISGLKTETLVKIFNTQGQELLKKTIKDTLDISNLINGVYFLKIKNEQTQKFIKE